jgi:putative ABC transport system permease protein
MLRSLIRVAIRNFRRDATYSLINVFGLAIGITGSLLLILYVYDDLSYDRFHEKSERIYRISSRISEPDDAFNWAVTQVPLAPQLMADYPEVEEAVRLIQSGRHLYTYEDKEFFEEEVSYSDSNLFRVFDYEWVAGDPETALTEPNSIVLTRSFSERYFGDANPVGKQIAREDEKLYNITGLIEDLPHNTNYKFSAMISRNSLPENWGSWGAFHIYTFVLLQEGFDPDVFEAKLPELYTNHMAEIFERMGIHIVYDVLPVTWIHLHSDFHEEPVPVGNMNYVYIFIAIIVLLILIASMNYMNLATARATKRSREIGIRKVAGSSRSILIRQFLVESMVLTLLALIISLVLLYVFLPTFNNLAGKSIEFSMILHPVILVSLLLVALITGILSGSYPAFFLSSFNPVMVMKGQLQIGRSNLNVRKILVVAQFTLSTFLVISTWIVYDQLNYLKNIDLGFDKEYVITLGMTTRPMVYKIPVLKEKLNEHPDILSVGSANTRIGEGSGKTIMRVETPEGMVERGINNFYVDHDFIRTVGIRIIDGRGFSEEFPGDTSRGVIINQTLAKRLNWEDPVGKKVTLPGDTSTLATVVGLMADYYQFGLYNVMEDQLFMYYPVGYMVYVKLSGQNTASTLEYIEQVWSELYPEFPFEYSFLDADFGEQFEADEKRGVVYTSFSVLTVLIACLGLFGLSSFVAEMRTKEIGIRKVHGSSARNIVSLMLKSYLGLIAVSVVLAAIIAWYFASDWLEGFVHRTSINWLSFVFAGLLTLVITVITVSYHTLRSASINPAESLRDE